MLVDKVDVDQGVMDVETWASLAVVVAVAVVTVVDDTVVAVVDKY